MEEQFTMLDAKSVKAKTKEVVLSLLTDASKKYLEYILSTIDKASSKGEVEVFISVDNNQLSREQQMYIWRFLLISNFKVSYHTIWTDIGETLDFNTWKICWI